MQTLALLHGHRALSCFAPGNWVFLTWMPAVLQRSNGRVCGVALGDASLLAQTATSVCSGIKDSNIAHVVSTMILRSAKVCGEPCLS